MAIDVNNARFLLSLKKNNVDFREVATIGRQGLFIPERLIQRLFHDHSVKPAPDVTDFADHDGKRYAEPFFQALGTKHHDSIDFSDYEGATVLHDMNLPVPANLQNKYGVLIDCGSIEHMFNFPQAIKNYADIVKVGGHLILLNMPVNNHTGHGFYQYSPELFYTLLSEKNGFSILKLLVAEDKPFTQFYEVINPKDAGERVGLCNNDPVLLFLIAKKINHVAELTNPVQYDYIRSWNKEKVSSSRNTSRTRSLISSVIKVFGEEKYFKFSVQRNWNIKRRKYSLSNSNFYKRTDIRHMRLDPRI